MKKTIALFLILIMAPGVSLARDFWGALAFNKETGRTGYTWNHWGPYGAKRAALRRCGYGCRIITTYRNSCIALAVGRGAYGWANNHDRYTAKRRARRQCRRYGGYRCRIRVSVCSGRRYY